MDSCPGKDLAGGLAEAAASGVEAHLAVALAVGLALAVQDLDCLGLEDWP